MKAPDYFPKDQETLVLSSKKNNFVKRVTPSFFAILLILTSVLFLFGCGNTDGSVVVRYDYDVGFLVWRNDNLKCQMYLTGTDQRWDYQCDEEYLEFLGEDFEEKAYENSDVKGSVFLNFKALKEGETKINVQQRNTLQADAVASLNEDFTFTVKINSDKHIEDVTFVDNTR
ncbi:MAG: hypothetical protein MJ189_04595 [Coriobacteriales bacterium]|nr:hypothetical protein [Coriobacteriales bacterium]